MQKLILDDGSVMNVIRAYQASSNTSLILETPDGFFFKNRQPVPDKIIINMGLKMADPEDVTFTKTYTGMGRALEAMRRKGVTEETHEPVETADGWIVRAKEKKVTVVPEADNDSEVSEV